MFSRSFKSIFSLRTPLHLGLRLSLSKSSGLAQTEEWVKNSHGELLLVKKENEKFEKFYREQAICSEEEWDEMLAAMRRGLPSVFRIISSKPEHRHFVRRLQGGAMSQVLMIF